jgi:hypothetical protein
MKCGTLVDRNGCDGFLEQCSAADGPGGYLLLNSFVGLNNVRITCPSYEGDMLTFLDNLELV